MYYLVRTPRRAQIQFRRNLKNPTLMPVVQVDLKIQGSQRYLPDTVLQITSGVSQVLNFHKRNPFYGNTGVSRLRFAKNENRSGNKCLHNV